jgi:subtilisin-like proprotein convertase family protein
MENLGTKQKKIHISKWGVKLSKEDTTKTEAKTTVVVDDTSNNSDSDEESTEGLNLRFKTANILDDLLDN